MEPDCAAIPDGPVIEKWPARFHCGNKNPATANFRNSVQITKRLPFWLYAAFFLTILEPACAKSIWDFQEPVTPIAHDSLTASVDFMRITMGIYAAVFAVFAYSIFRHRKAPAPGREPSPARAPDGSGHWWLHPCCC